MGSTAKAYQRLYESDRVDKAGMERAVTRGLITADEYKEIVGEDFPT